MKTTTKISTVLPKPFFLLVLGFLLLNCTNVYGQETSGNAQTPVISGLNPKPVDNLAVKQGIPQIPEPPRFVNTGNAEQDALNYGVAKEEWLITVVSLIESHLGPMEAGRKQAFMDSLRKVDFEAARAGDYTLPYIENPYGQGSKVELH